MSTTVETNLASSVSGYKNPSKHPSGASAPEISTDLLPRHIGLVMDGNGRWAKQRGLKRTAGHAKGEQSLFDVIEGAIELGVPYLSAYAFSTENWKRSPEEVRWLMGFNKDTIIRRSHELNELGVRVVWAGRKPKLWKSVLKKLRDVEELTKNNDRLIFQFCVNYGGRLELVDAVRKIAEEAAAGKLDPRHINEKTIQSRLYCPQIPDVDLFIRSSGEQRISNFLLWQSAYAELIFTDTLWPDFDRTHLWQAVLDYTNRDRRFGGVK